MKQPHTQSLNDALKTHYESKSLSSDQLDKLIAMQTAADDSFIARLKTKFKASTLGRYTTDFKSYRYAFYTTTCLLLMTLVVSFSLLNRGPLSDRIMQEIAYNHQQEMPTEISSNSLIKIGDYLNKLTFPLIDSDAMTTQKWQILGGRYCSINGKLAAQLKVKNLEDSKTYTLYQAALGTDISKVLASTKEQAIEGVSVSIWQEKGLLLGLAHSN